METEMPSVALNVALSNLMTLFEQIPTRVVVEKMQVDLGAAT